MTQKLNIGICGLGRSGYGIHCKAIKQMSELFRIKAIYDPIEQRANEVSQEFNATKHESFEALINDPELELIVISSPNKFHAQQTQAALTAKKHVLCEKPFGLNLADVNMMIATAKSNKKILQAFQQRRYEYDFLKVKEICESGILGDIQFIRICWHAFKRRWDWQTSRACAGGMLNNNGPHPIDHALELLGANEAEVWAETKSCLCSGDAEDYLKIILSAPSCPSIEIELNDITAYAQDRWFVCGSAGGLRGNANKLEWKWMDWSKMPERPLDLNPTQDRSYNSEKLDWQEASWTPDSASDAGAGATPASQPVYDLYKELYETIVCNKPQSISPQSVRYRIEILEKVRKFCKIDAIKE